MSQRPALCQVLRTCRPAWPGTHLVVPSAPWVLGAVVPAAREWRGNGRKAQTSEGTKSYG